MSTGLQAPTSLGPRGGLCTAELRSLDVLVLESSPWHRQENLEVEEVSNSSYVVSEIASKEAHLSGLSLVSFTPSALGLESVLTFVDVTVRATGRYQGEPLYCSALVSGTTGFAVLASVLQYEATMITIRCNLNQTLHGDLHLSIFAMSESGSDVLASTRVGLMVRALVLEPPLFTSTRI